MSTKYLCPNCKNCLNVDQEIVLIGKTKTGLKGVVFLHTELGNYISKFSNEFDVVEGNVLSFSCPLCHAKLTNVKNKNKAELILVDEKGKKSTILFSKIFGEQCTYRIVNQEISQQYGEQNEDITTRL